MRRTTIVRYLGEPVIPEYRPGPRPSSFPFPVRHTAAGSWITHDAGMVP